ncbi:DUF1127 domain-containing protein [Phaeovulum vinaykumarii]|uniref:Uncharacterized conserved protein YjiS, DUF1127 family n=1 Tax=Phaeovulum vinaykumarii TaxID=407234 RepID=A0A1N7K2N5_9RHOB|nr:DUF1127 domain-containing protein [Phaeovulum vinaykumarii]SIS55862.1 Uncharacterized conserved protein YjiS, DUF1127 family [Phaeovulum vinaykumarii]SOB92593.1 uncharacterized protein YjiS [Phaeovulum vinaykumarii]
MSVFDIAHGTRRHSLAGFLQPLVTAFEAWNDARHTRAALQMLSDRELDDIGLTRAEIETVARRR